MINDLDPRGILLEPYFNRPLGKFNLYTGDNISRYIMKMISQERELSGYERRMAIVSNLLPLVSEIRENFLVKTAGSGTAWEDDSSGSELIDYINENLSRDLSLDALAERFFISKSQLNRRFKKLTGATVGEYIAAKRLLYARERIFDGVPAAQASSESGFNDYSAFYRAYKKKFGVTPGRR